MARVLALVGAVALVAAAVLLRRELDEGGGEVAEPDRGRDPGAELVVACVPELAAACDDLEGAEVRFQSPAETMADAAAVDAWVTFDPWPAVAQDLLGAGTPLASTELLLVVRAGSPAAGCRDWACAGAAGGALPRPTSALGLLALGHASLQWADETRPGQPFARQELDLPEYRSWLGGVDRQRRDPLQDMLQLGPAGPPATVALATDADDRVAGSREEGNLELVPTGSVSVVVAGRSGDEVAPALRDALAERGWDVGDEPSAGIPNAGVLRAIREVVG